MAQRPIHQRERQFSGIDGAIVQSSSSLTAVASADGNLQIANPIVIRCVAKKAADNADDTTIFAKNAPFKFRVVDWWYRIISKRTGGTPDHKVKLVHGDGAGSETTNAATDQVDVDSAAATDFARGAEIKATYNEVDAGESLYANLTVAGGTDTGTAEVEFYVLIIPVA